MTLSDEAHQDRGRHRRPQAELKDDLCACLMYSVHDTSPLVGGQIVPPPPLVAMPACHYRGRDVPWQLSTHLLASRHHCLAQNVRWYTSSSTAGQGH